MCSIQECRPLRLHCIRSTVLSFFVYTAVVFSVFVQPSSTCTSTQKKNSNGSTRLSRRAIGGWTSARVPGVAEDVDLNRCPSVLCLLSGSGRKTRRFTLLLGGVGVLQSLRLTKTPSLCIRAHVKPIFRPRESRCRAACVPTICRYFL